MSIKVSFDPAKFKREMENQVMGLVKREAPKMIAKMFRAAKTGEKPRVTLLKTPTSLRGLESIPVKLEGSNALLNNIKEDLDNSAKK